MVGTISKFDVEHKALLHHIQDNYETATFGMGCFWGADALFGATPGVLRTEVGYSGGTLANPVYRNLGDHVEVITIEFDPKKITFHNLLSLFWNNHEYGLTKHVKRQYASIIFYYTDEQRKMAHISLEKQRLNRIEENIITEIVKVGIIYMAEDFHQKHYLQNHRDLMYSLKLDAKLLKSSHVAARLNGYLVGVGGMHQYLNEANNLGLNRDQKEYVHPWHVSK